jgi:hypothetical protein
MNLASWPATPCHRRKEAHQREEAERSDLLAYRDAAGLVADFYSLRHLYISRIVRSGATPKVAQELARHCAVRLTLGGYAHAALHDLTAAVDAMSDLFASCGAQQMLAATGTDGKGGETGAKNLGPNLGSSGAILGDLGRLGETEIVNAEGCGKPRKSRGKPRHFWGFVQKGPSRIRTGDGGFAIRCLTAWLRGRGPSKRAIILAIFHDRGKLNFQRRAVLTRVVACERWLTLAPLRSRTNQ